MTASPFKRNLTDQSREATLASNMHHNDMLGDDLLARLQNVGARARKNVSQGYASSTPTPFSSPVKPPTAHTSPAYFRSQNEILNDVFASPYQTPSSSPKKRSREEPDDSDVRMRLFPNAQLTDLESDDEDLEIVTCSDEGEENASKARPIRPMPRSRNGSASSIPNGGAGSFNAASGEGIFNVPLLRNHTNTINDDDIMDTYPS